jgi:hypothetical protein
MTIKEFAQKNGVYFFYSTIILFVLTIVFLCTTFCTNQRSFYGKSFHNRKDGMMMERGGRGFDSKVNKFRKQNLLQEDANPKSEVIPASNITE